MKAAGGHGDPLPLRRRPWLLGGSQAPSEGEGPQAPSPSIFWSSRGLPGSWGVAEGRVLPAGTAASQLALRRGGVSAALPVSAFSPC